ncbi:hypothetical protein chiPu_0031941, partial [Chiloscyllium punctatum]|nr:hypothetical protein [Chiloscyllium punctatum]
MDDEAQRRQVVAAPRLLRQAQQPHEHGRHHMHVRDAVALDQLQQIFGIEARLEHDAAAVAERQHAVGMRGRMVHRPVHQDHLILVGLYAVGDGADAGGRRHLLGPHRLAPDALRQSGGARGVEHRRGADRGIGQRRMRVAPLVPVGHAIRHPRQFRRHAIGGGDLRRRRHDQQFDFRRQSVPDLRQEIRVADQRVGA